MADSPARLAAEIRKLEQKHEEDPDGRYFVPLANAYRQLGELEHAELLLRDGLRRHPEYLSAHIVLGRCLLDRGDPHGAEEEFRRVLAADPQNLIALRTLAELATADGRWAEAEHWYAELLAADPLNEDARRQLETVKTTGQRGQQTAHREEETTGEEQGSEESAEAVLPISDSSLPTIEEEAELDEGEVVTETIAELYARQGVYDRAAEVYRELLRRRGESPELVARLREIESLAEAGGRGALQIPPLQPAPVLEAEGEAEAPEEILSPASAPVQLEPAEGAAEVATAAEPASPQPSGASRTIADYLAELLAWTPSPGANTTAESRPHASAADQERAPGLASGTSGREYAAARPEGFEATRAETAEFTAARPSPEDEGELESFQTWLRSLNR